MRPMPTGAPGEQLYSSNFEYCCRFVFGNVPRATVKEMILDACRIKLRYSREKTEYTYRLIFSNEESIREFKELVFEQSETRIRGNRKAHALLGDAQAFFLAVQECAPETERDVLIRGLCATLRFRPLHERLELRDNYAAAGIIAEEEALAEGEPNDDQVDAEAAGDGLLPPI